jgi:NAD(P)-dependent dehydrogenase (short-subunit alcohol dehydrogenase family)
MTAERRTVLITGASRGLGLGMAMAFAANGDALVIDDLDGEAAERAAVLVRERGVPAVSVAGDVSVRADAARIVQAAIEAFGRLDVLVNNAQWTFMGPLEQATDADLDRTWRSGLGGTFTMMQEALPHLRATKGSVINLVSGASISANKDAGVYGATKAAIGVMSRVAAIEWGPTGVRVNCISPSARTEALDGWAQQFPEEYAARSSTIPLGRFGDPEQDIGRVAVFLASDAASYITGATIVADGGVHYLG